MNVIGERISIASSKDPTIIGAAGVVVMETAKTLLVDTGSKTLRVAKSGQVFVLHRSGAIVLGDEIIGKPEDRIGARRK